MARKYLLTMCPAAQVPPVNNMMVVQFGDDPGSQEITLNAYVDGADPLTATHSVGVANCSQADANAIGTFIAGTAGCDSVQFPTSPATDFWAEALTRWNLKPVV